MLKSRSQALAEIASVNRRISRLAEEYRGLMEEAEKPDASQAFLNLTLCVGDLIAEGLNRAADLIECLEAGRTSGKREPVPTQGATA